MAEAKNGGCFKVLAITIVALGLAAAVFWKLSQVSGRAADVASLVVTPYLEEVRLGRYERALEQYASDDMRARVSADELKQAYKTLETSNGKFLAARLTGADELNEPASPARVRVRYTLEFEKAEENVVYDVIGEGDEARITASYDQTSGRDTLSSSVR